MDNSTSPKFIGPEFNQVFKRIQQKQNKLGYRQLNKFHGLEFENCIDTARVRYENLRSFSQSKFSQNARILNVEVRNDLEDWSELRFVSGTYLPKIEKVNVTVLHEISKEDFYFQIKASEPLIFRGVNFMYNCESKRSYLIVDSSDNIEIYNSTFKKIGLYITNVNNLIAKYCTFENCVSFAVSNVKNQIFLENIETSKTLGGIEVDRCKDTIVNNVIIDSNSIYNGCEFNDIDVTVNLSNAKIYGAYIGILITRCNRANIQNCNVDDFKEHGIAVSSSIVNYQRLYFDNNLVEYKNNLQDNLVGSFGMVQSVFSRIL